MTEYRDKADTEQCYFCPKRTDIQVHHIVPQRFNGSDNRENLVALCERCHEKIENLYDKRFYEKLGVEDESGQRESHFECLTCNCRAETKISVHASVASWYCTECAAEFAERKVKMIQAHMFEPKELINIHDTVLNDEQEAMEKIIEVL